MMQVKTASGNSAYVEIFDEFVIGTTHLERMCDIPSKLASLLVCAIQLKNEHDIDFVKYVKIENDVLTWCCMRLDTKSYDEYDIDKHYNIIDHTDFVIELESVCENIVGSWKWLDYRMCNCGYYNNNYYCFDAFYELPLSEKYLRQLELVFNLESGILDKYNQEAKRMKDE